MNLDVAHKMFSIPENRYRFIGIPYTIKVDSWKEIEMYIKMYNGYKHLFISLASYINKVPYLNYIYFDFDGKDAQDDVEEITTYFDYYNWIPYYIIKSSKYGRHVYLKVPDFPYTKNVYLNVYKIILSDLSLSSFDTHVKGKTVQLTRIPGTINIKNNTFCEFDENNKFDLGDKPTLNPNFLEQENPKYTFNNYSNENKYLLLHTYPCLERQMEYLEPPHIARVYYVSTLISLGYNDKEIFEKLKGFHWIDFSPDITMYQINHIRQGGYKPPSCETIQERGYCLSTCPRWKKN